MEYDRRNATNADRLGAPKVGAPLFFTKENAGGIAL